MKSGFLTPLDVRLKDGDRIWIVASPLKYYSELLQQTITVPPWFESENVDAEKAELFETDFASIPRYIPLASNVLLDRAHREGVLHDMLYRIDSVPVVERVMADRILLEAMESAQKPWYIRYPIYWGVRIGGASSYHKKKMTAKL